MRAMGLDRRTKHEHSADAVIYLTREDADMAKAKKSVPEVAAKSIRKRLSEDELAQRAIEREAVYQRLLTSGDLDEIWPGWAAGRFLGVSEITLAHWRRIGSDKGPKYVRLSPSKVGYRKRALVAHIESREFSSTSNDPGALYNGRRSAGGAD